MSAADRCSVDSLPGIICKTKGDGFSKRKRTRRDPAENEDDDSESDQYVDDFSHLATTALVVSDDVEE